MSEAAGLSKQSAENVKKENEATLSEVTANSRSSDSCHQTILEEVFTSDYNVTDEEIKDYANYLGIDSEKEPHLVLIAKKALLAPLPFPWKPVLDKLSRVYYYNSRTGKSTWDHPIDSIVRDIIISEREKTKASGTDSCFDELKTEEEVSAQLQSKRAESQELFEEDKENLTLQDKVAGRSLKLIDSKSEKISPKSFSSSSSNSYSIKDEKSPQRSQQNSPCLLPEEPTKEEDSREQEVQEDEDFQPPEEEAPEDSDGSYALNDRDSSVDKPNKNSPKESDLKKEEADMQSPFSYLDSPRAVLAPIGGRPLPAIGKKSIIPPISGSLEPLSPLRHLAPLQLSDKPSPRLQSLKLTGKDLVSRQQPTNRETEKELCSKDDDSEEREKQWSGRDDSSKSHDLPKSILKDSYCSGGNDRLQMTHSPKNIRFQLSTDDIVFHSSEEEEEENDYEEEIEEEEIEYELEEEEENSDSDGKSDLSVSREMEAVVTCTQMSKLKLNDPSELTLSKNIKDPWKQDSPLFLQSSNIKPKTSLEQFKKDLGNQESAQECDVKGSEKMMEAVSAKPLSGFNERNNSAIGHEMKTEARAEDLTSKQATNKEFESQNKSTKASSVNKKEDNTTVSSKTSPRKLDNHSSSSKERSEIHLSQKSGNALSNSHTGYILAPLSPIKSHGFRTTGEYGTMELELEETSSPRNVKLIQMSVANLGSKNRNRKAVLDIEFDSGSPQEFNNGVAVCQIKDTSPQGSDRKTKEVKWSFSSPDKKLGEDSLQRQRDNIEHILVNGTSNKQSKFRDYHLIKKEDSERVELQTQNYLKHKTTEVNEEQDRSTRNLPTEEQIGRIQHNKTSHERLVETSKDQKLMNEGEDEDYGSKSQSVNEVLKPEIFFGDLEKKFTEILSKKTASFREEHDRQIEEIKEKVNNNLEKFKNEYKEKEIQIKEVQSQKLQELESNFIEKLQAITDYYNQQIDQIKRDLTLGRTKPEVLAEFPITESGASQKDMPVASLSKSSSSGSIKESSGSSPKCSSSLQDNKIRKTQLNESLLKPKEEREKVQKLKSVGTPYSDFSRLKSYEKKYREMKSKYVDLVNRIKAEKMKRRRGGGGSRNLNNEFVVSGSESTGISDPDVALSTISSAKITDNTSTDSYDFNFLNGKVLYFDEVYGNGEKIYPSEWVAPLSKPGLTSSPKKAWEEDELINVGKAALRRAKKVLRSSGQIAKWDISNIQDALTEQNLNYERQKTLDSLQLRTLRRSGLSGAQSPDTESEELRKNHLWYGAPDVASAELDSILEGISRRNVADASQQTSNILENLQGYQKGDSAEDGMSKWNNNNDCSVNIKRWGSVPDLAPDIVRQITAADEYLQCRWKSYFGEIALPLKGQNTWASTSNIASTSFVQSRGVGLLSFEKFPEFYSEHNIEDRIKELKKWLNDAHTLSQ